MKQKDVEQLRLEELKKLVCDICGVSTLEGRSYKVVCARSIIYHHLKQVGYSPLDIGAMFGRSRSSVIHLLNKYDDMLRYDREFKRYVDEYEDRN